MTADITLFWAWNLKVWSRCPWEPPPWGLQRCTWGNIVRCRTMSSCSAGVKHRIPGDWRNIVRLRVLLSQGLPWSWQGCDQLLHGVLSQGEGHLRCRVHELRQLHGEELWRYAVLWVQEDSGRIWQVCWGENGFEEAPLWLPLPA